MKILVAEDEAIMLKTIELKLKKDEHEVIICSDGKVALQKIEEERPDIIVTDIMLPYSSGLEIVGIVRNGNINKNIPIIILSAMGQESVVEEAFSLGADDYITKPFSLTELSIRIKRLARN
jgi:DNA-binding response OmpR family regulator